MSDDIFEEENELGDGCDSNGDCEKIDKLNKAAELATQWRLLSMIDDEANESIVDSP